ncbi:hypothetical protein RCO28_38525 [Streptomyces sp. LHD-70]|uniref:hypothetical protein n=1 Tax=Streptomyces sp. LHD-70 TaxID=3072140 RepID=UPI00280DF324|nr:hypothetical protein [Streptomyces sp. LHD-70]MDQ8708313.1 hypothetical protein [Streptomyces sp. LHD-70]
MSRSVRKHQISAIAACLGALAYTVAKVDLARRGEVGMPGFPAPLGAADRVGDVAAAQLGNAGLGFGMAVVAVALLRPVANPVLRWGAIGVSWLGIAAVGAGVVGFGARAVGMAPALGAPPSHLVPAVAALLVGAVWVGAWGVATVGAMRGASRPERP